MSCRLFVARLGFCIAAVFCGAFSAAALPNSDIIFVTQIPIPNDFATVNSTFGNQSGSVTERGFGDLYIRYTDGSVRNLTAAAGFGNTGMQNASSIAVRDPVVHWNGAKVLFSMVVGAATAQYQVKTYRWQLYEIEHFGQNETPVITKVANQPSTYNNIMPAYASDGTTIIFASDRPHNGAAHLYPQRDEYESTATNSGLWSLKPSSGELKLLDHAPSGDFHPTIDSFGRVIFTRWDHLQRDQQADTESGGDKGYGAFNFSSEAADSVKLNSIQEYFPEHQDSEAQAEANPLVNENRINHFFPWMMDQDGQNLETVNHIGRHELHGYIPRSFNNDNKIEEFYGQYSRTNPRSIESFHQIKEDPAVPGRYYGIDCPEFGTHASGQIVRMDMPPNLKASSVVVDYVTHRSTASTSNSPGSDHSGLYRNPTPLSDGTLIASHTTATAADSNIGSSTAPLSKYAYRIKTLSAGAGGYMVGGALLTPGITKSVSYWSPDQLMTYSGTMWELQPVEVKARTAPVPSSGALQSPELSVFADTSTDITALKQFLVQNNLALIIGRNLTTRDSLDIQQPYNLQVENGVKSVGNNGKLYTIKHLQFFQGDQIRGYGSGTNTGRRVLAVPLHDGYGFNPENAGGPAGSVKVSPDGSFSALVPARRALTWQLTDPLNEPVVRERYWLTFQPGEIRVCGSCHGVTGHDQAGHDEPVNPPQALGTLMQFIKGLPPGYVPPDATPIPDATPNPDATPGPNDPDGGGSFTLKVSRTKLEKMQARYRIAVSGGASQKGKSLTIKLTLGTKTCSAVKRTVTLGQDGKALVNLVTPLLAKPSQGQVGAVVSGETAATKSFAIPKLKFFTRKAVTPAKSCSKSSMK